MLRTSICDLLGIDVPIIQAGMGTFTSADLVAAVSNAGALGSLGAGTRSMESLKEQLARVHELTDRPFAVNFTLVPVPPTPEALSLTLAAKPRLVSLALGDPSEVVKRVHDAGILVMHQVANVRQAEQAAQSGVDMIIAQGTEAGGFAGSIAALVLVPQVVDAVRPVPVIAAGGIADGRGLAAVLVLGAQAANIGTRFLASLEAPISNAWKQAIISSQPQDALKIDFWADVFPAGPQSYPVIPRALSSPFIEAWRDRREAVRDQAGQLRAEISASAAQGKFGELFPFAGQSVGLIREILPAAEIVRKLVSEAESALKQAERFVS
jgi:enoyl-[acyl-carrier protein] reductase II